MNKPFSEACERNAQPILEIITPYLAHAESILEIGSGTGQHAVYFAKHLRHLFWQTSDQSHYHEGIRLWLKEYPFDNIGEPLTLDVTKDWPKQTYSALYSANTSHIMSWEMNQYFFKGIDKVLQPKGYFLLYGPFNQDGMFTSESNQKFDAYLKQQNPDMGLRDMDDLKQLADKAQLKWVTSHTMPSNNFILVWQKQ